MITSRWKSYIFFGFVVLFALRGSSSLVAMVPAAATQTFLDNITDARATISSQRVTSLYGAILAENNADPCTAPECTDNCTPAGCATTDEFVQAFLDLPANANAMGVIGPDLEYVDKVNVRQNKFTFYSYRQKIESLPVHGSVVKILVRHDTDHEKITNIGINLTQPPASSLPSQNELTAELAIDVVEAEYPTLI